MVRGGAPVRERQDIGLASIPFPRQTLAEEDVINPAVAVFLAIVMGPSDLARLEAWVGIRTVVAVAFGRTGVHQRQAPAADQGADGPGILGVVEVAEDEEVRFGRGLEAVGDYVTEDQRFLFAQFRFVRPRRRPARLQMPGKEGDRKS